MRDALDVESGTLERELTLARWDWAKPTNRRSGPPIINARIEKLTTGFWGGAFSNSRCIVPMEPGYIEWTGERGSKQPHLIHGDGILAAAGLTWTADIAGDRRRVFVVITRQAVDASGEIHDRMPAFLTADPWDDWLNPASLTTPGGPDDSRRQLYRDRCDHEHVSRRSTAQQRAHRRPIRPDPVG